MKNRTVFFLICLGLSANLLIAAEDNAAGKKAEETSCQLCHSLRLVDSQRLSSAAWQKEVDKMIGWGAVVADRQLLVDYLSQHYSNNLPQPSPILSTKGK